MIIGDRKKAPMIVVAKKLADGGEVHSEVKPEDSMGDHEQALNDIALDLIDAVGSKSAHGVVSAFKAMFQALEMEPHEEYGESEE